MGVVLGAIADDFTGATDLASTWVKQGVRTVQVIGVPEAGADLDDADAVVVALKTRTAPVAEAVAQSLAALDWLRGQGARQVVFKYCSTFDSTAQGNIGPVADALLDALGEDFALICPAFPANGRTVYMGHLFVGEALLSDSPMKDHPLTPMRDASLIRLMQAQSAHRVGLVPLRDVQAGVQAVSGRIGRLRAEGIRYGVGDAVNEDDLRVLGQAVAGHGLVTGGSGIGLGLPQNLRAKGLLGAATTPRLPDARGRALVLAGSCSAATRGQIGAVQNRWPARKIDIDALAGGADEARDATDWALAQPDDTPVLVYSSADPAEVAAIQARHGTERAGQLAEAALSRIATTLRDRGFNRIVVAGGETSGAVVSALGATQLRIGPEIAPGVPWCEAPDGTALALKSGNFGGPDFFSDALGMRA